MWIKTSLIRSVVICGEFSLEIAVLWLVSITRMGHYIEQCQEGDKRHAGCEPWHTQYGQPGAQLFVDTGMICDWYSRISNYTTQYVSRSSNLCTAVRINPGKASGAYNLSLRVYWRNWTVLADPLARILHKSMTSGCIPRDWKHANVTPVFKKGQK